MSRGRFPITLFALFLAAACAAPLRTEAARTCAEWEPAKGVLVAWPAKNAAASFPGLDAGFGLPGELLVAMAERVPLFVMVNSEADRGAAEARLTELGIAPESYEFVPSTVETIWPRDFGAHEVFGTDGNLRLVDAIYIDTPLFDRDAPAPRRGEKIEYQDTWPGDDHSNEGVAAHLGLELVELPACVTGGNFLVDGHGRAFSTDALLFENLVSMDAERFRRLVREYTGVQDLVLLENTEPEGIQHIDCWLKLVDEETLLVKRAPQDHPEYAAIERNVEKLERLRTCFGRPYRILRIDCPRYGPGGRRRDPIAAYTNALILERTVYVPLFGIEADQQALRTWREALPGYEVLGFRHPTFRSFDAIHCRTRALFDPGMLRIDHAPLRNDVTGPGPFVVEARIEACSREPLVEDATALCWRKSGEREWRRVPLLPSRRGVRSARIPAQLAGTSIEYYLAASDGSGRRETHPRTAPAGFHSFRVAP